MTNYQQNINQIITYFIRVMATVFHKPFDNPILYILEQNLSIPCIKTLFYTCYNNLTLYILQQPPFLYTIVWLPSATKTINENTNCLLCWNPCEEDLTGSKLKQYDMEDMHVSHAAYPPISMLQTDPKKQSRDYSLAPISPQEQPE